MLSTLSGITQLREQDYKRSDFLSKGNLAEQFIHQHLLYSMGSNVRPESFYWLREGKQGNAEVDFLLQINMQIIPIEVKAGSAGSLKSLVQFLRSKGSTVALRFDMNPPSSQTIRHTVEQGFEKMQLVATLLSLPLYAVEETRRLLETQIRLETS